MIRNLEELGLTLQKIVTRLFANQSLLKLLYYTDKDPLSQTDLTESQIKTEIYEKLIKITPKVKSFDSAKSIITLVIEGGNINENDEFINIVLNVELYVPLTSWIIKNQNLRPFAILGQIKQSLDGKNINGIGKLVGGDFHLNFVTEEVANYEMNFTFTQYD